MPYRTTLLPCLISVILAAPAVEAQERAAGRPLVVVELFTSQGCSNCPPADGLLAELARDRNVVALSFAVDYWDYMGWKDTAARPEFTRRQRSYATRRGDRDVFTPQVVINGRTRHVGSDRPGIERAIAETAERRDVALSVDVENGRGEMIVRIAEPKDAIPTRSATVWLVRFDRLRSVSVGRGENTGRKLSYAHLVRSIQPIGMWKGHALTIELPHEEFEADRNLGCAVLIQSEADGLPGPILGAGNCAPPTI